jgi:hypothetical protein
MACNRDIFTFPFTTNKLHQNGISKAHFPFKLISIHIDLFITLLLLLLYFTALKNLSVWIKLSCIISKFRISELFATLLKNNNACIIFSYVYDLFPYRIYTSTQKISLSIFNRMSRNFNPLLCCNFRLTFSLDFENEFLRNLGVFSPCLSAFNTSDA